MKILMMILLILLVSAAVLAVLHMLPDMRTTTSPARMRPLLQRL